MNAPQGTFGYTGINPADIVSGSFTLTHGISPSVCTLYVTPRASTFLKTGTLTISYGTTVLTFANCAADKLTREIGRDGRELWSVPIFDRRWAWKFAGRVSGYYNVRRDCIVTATVQGPDGTTTRKRNSTAIMPGTERTPRELARLCLEAIGEQRYDLSRMPDDSRPEIEWNYALPAEALANVADAAGCRVVLRLNGTVAILPAGEGERLPVDHLATEGGGDLDSPERPDRIVVVSSPIRHQGNFDLEAVGEDTDGTIRPIEQLSYRPEGGWRNVHPDDCFAVQGTRERLLAKKSYLRWYRIKTPLRLPGLKLEVSELDSILPITDRQVETWDVETGQQGGRVQKRLEPRPAWVYGHFTSDKTLGMASNDEKRVAAEESKVGDDVTSRPKTLYLGSYTIDVELGIVRFGEPVYLLEPHAPDGQEITGGGFLPARLRLRTAVSLRDPATRGWLCREFPRKLDGAKAGTPARYIVKPDIELAYWWEQNDATKTLDAKHNLDECEIQARHYLDAAEREYEFTGPATVQYAGIRSINPDGAIQQVTWWVDDRGFAYTRASRNREELIRTPSYAEKRMMERMQAELERSAQTARQQRNQHERGRA